MYKAVITILFIIVLVVPISVDAFDAPDNGAPKTANLFWKTPITQSEARELARWDLVALDMQAGTNSATNIRLMRQINPDIIILAYTSATEVHLTNFLNVIEPSGSGLWHELTKNAKSQWQLKTHDGQNISWWKDNISMNLFIKDRYGKTYGDFLVNFYDKKVMSTGLWDGLLFDTVYQDVSWVDANIDIDGDGQKDTTQKIDSLWQKGHQDFFEKLRSRLGDDYVIIGNGVGQYHEYLNGRMLESFPEFWEGGWTGSMEDYKNNSNTGYGPRINIVNSDTDNTGVKESYKSMRYGLTSTLLHDGYFSFDYGTQSRNQLWQYDEYSVNLGDAKSEANNFYNQEQEDYTPGIWQREYANGLVLVNSTDQKQYIKFDEEYEKIHGSQDPIVNNGSRVNYVGIDSQDGLVLIRPTSEINSAFYTNGAFARVFDGQGENVRTGFFAYNQKYRGSTKIITEDINNNGRIETILVDNQKITIYSQSGKRLKTFAPYGYDYTNGLSVTLGDLNGNGKYEIITGTKNGASNEIRIFDWYGRKFSEGWYAYKKEWVNLGINVAAGDLNGDGKDEIIAAAGLGGGPHIKIFNKSGVLLSEFFAYDTGFRGGTFITTADTNGDGTSEIVTGSGKGHEPVAKIFNLRGQLQKSWLAFDKNNTSGIEVAASDVDGDNKDEIFTLTTNVFTISANKF